MTDSLVHCILLVEDDEAFAQTLVEMLESWQPGQQVVPHVTSLEAAQAALQVPFRYDLLILDLSLPGTKEFLTLKTMLAMAPGVPIVVVTGGVAETEASSIAQGAVGFCQKWTLAKNFSGFLHLLRHGMARQAKINALLDDDEPSVT